jgi:methyl-accepting chemotaxis protein
MVEQTSAAARNLSSQVGALAEQAARFKVADDGYLRSARAVQSPPKATPAPAKRARAKMDADNYGSPIKQLPAAAVAALSRPDDDWNEF